ncbi:MAG: ABC transporter ATP-binding protein/permease [Lachnospiraceae bacterium]|nr:ABC transporter ATP-binding protein/permease [Lachnospiraceae bacterium]
MKLGKYLSRYWKQYIFAIICLIVYEALDMVSPQVAKSLVDDVIRGGKVELLVNLLLILLIVGIGRVLAGYGREYTFDKVSFRAGSDIRKRLIEHIQKLGVDFFDRTNTGEIMSRVTSDVEAVQSAFGYIGMLAIQIVLHTAMVLYFMFRISWKLTLFPVVALPICGVLAIILEKKLDKVYDDISEENAKMNTVAEENLAGVRVVKAFAREKFEIGKFLGHNKTYYDLNMKMSLEWVRYDPIFAMVSRLLPITAVLFGGVLVIRQEITLGELSAFVAYCENAVWPMEMLGWIANSIASAFASKKKIDKIFAEKPSIEAPEASGDEEFEFKSFEFDHVSLTIGDKEILKDISFKLEAGKTLGIMGATGAGKTSVINLILRFYDPTEGVIRLNGTDIRELPFETVRRASAAVMQDVFLFSDTIVENVRLGSKDSITDEDIETALDASCAAEFVAGLGEGHETVIGERGVGLSGGQKQRISMARAFAKHAPLLILDDSTSALDMETEHQVQKNIGAMGGMTKIIVAHRISAVRRAEEIIVLEGGKVLERGTHAELMDLGGYYYDTYLAQYGEAMDCAEVQTA